MCFLYFCYMILINSNKWKYDTLDQLFPFTEMHSTGNQREFSNTYCWKKKLKMHVQKNVLQFPSKTAHNSIWTNMVSSMTRCMIFVGIMNVRKSHPPHETLSFFLYNSYRKTQLYLSTKLAFWEIQLSGCGKPEKRPIPSFWVHLCGRLLFLVPSLWAFNLSSPISVAL